MKLNSTPRFNVDADTARWYRDIARQVNSLSEGSISAAYNARAAAPTTGIYQIGDVIRNSEPAELGTAASKYLIMGWTCVAAPCTWLENRSLTGN